MKLIDKDVLVAEIKRRKELVSDPILSGDDLMIGERNAYFNLLSFINTLEVKEDNLLSEKKIEKELAEDYINIFDKKFGNKLPNLKGKQLADFKNFINTCEQTFHIKYFDYHATQGKLFEKLALLWAVWGKEYLSLEVKEVDLDRNISAYLTNHFNVYEDGVLQSKKSSHPLSTYDIIKVAKYFFELGINVMKGE